MSGDAFDDQIYREFLTWFRYQSLLENEYVVNGEVMDTRIALL